MSAVKTQWVEIGRGTSQGWQTIRPQERKARLSRGLAAHGPLAVLHDPLWRKIRFLSRTDSPTREDPLTGLRQAAALGRRPRSRLVERVP
jgi:hypothetical protein